MLSAADKALLNPLYEALHKRQHRVMEAFFEKYKVRGTLSQLMAVDCYALGQAYWAQDDGDHPDYHAMIRLMEEGVQPDRFDPINSPPIRAAYSHENISALAILFWFADASPIEKKLTLDDPVRKGMFDCNTQFNVYVKEMYDIRQTRHAADEKKTKRLFHDAVMQYRQVAEYCQRYEKWLTTKTVTDPSVMPVLEFFQKQLKHYRYEVYRCLQQIDAEYCMSTSADIDARHKPVLEELSALAKILEDESNAAAYRARVQYTEERILLLCRVAPVTSAAALPAIPEASGSESDSETASSATSTASSTGSEADPSESATANLPPTESCAPKEAAVLRHRVSRLVHRDSSENPHSLNK